MSVTSLGFDSLVLHLKMHEKLRIVEAEWELNVYFTWLTRDRSHDHRYMMHSWMVRRSMQWLPKNSRGFYRKRAAWPVVKMIYYMDSYYVASSRHKRLHYCFLDQQCMICLLFLCLDVQFAIVVRGDLDIDTNQWCTFLLAILYAKIIVKGASDML
jgi:hypothetical protein